MRRVAPLATAAVLGCRPSIIEPAPSERIEVSHPGASLTFAVIGDFGRAGPDEQAVAKLVHSWTPEIIITVGDNNYPHGSASTLDENVGQYYHSFIAPYEGSYGKGATVNRFFPALGNHDWRTTNLRPHLEYFSLPGNERYYDFRWGPVHFFALDSDRNEPDGHTQRGKQAAWLEQTLAHSDAAWKVVYQHHPPLSSGSHGPTYSAQWPYFAWGADVVLAGHDHHYERIERDDGVYIVNGLGGFPKIYPTGAPVPGSQKIYNTSHGAMRVQASQCAMVFEFYSVQGELVDRSELLHEPCNAVQDNNTPEAAEVYDD